MHTTGHNLPQLLGQARRWFEEALLETLRKRGQTPVSPTQLQLFSVLDERGATISELAQWMGVTRQTTHQAVHGLMDAGLLEQSPHPESASRRLIRRTRLGRQLHGEAEAVLDELERELARRIGSDTVEQLRTALEASWGEPPNVDESGN
ncbi:MarR family winged helix-turn-helix transcriptional regulator [Actinopolyspora mortivallis]|uniref:MarR family transcriptional regulator n=1 Tax=Actinopolyspora mortivallis TaxID=33906 RepID=A0A2T0GWN2_ACTMO|nr:MarR family winged helix-turn-helix transcriptional regulator [Actinopolyspora mortivallis]PRW63520.1 MarR family transcriptional regulator [Actinopolyspora mortivallis]